MKTLIAIIESVIAYQYETSTDYYPSDEDIIGTVDRRILKLCEVSSRGEGKDTTGSEAFDYITDELREACKGCDWECELFESEMFVNLTREMRCSISNFPFLWICIPIIKVSIYLCKDCIL